VTARVSRAIEHRINFGDYEGITLTATAETDCDEGQQQAALGRMADLLANALDDDITQAKKFATENSYVHEWEG
jgi:hypothetical protein